MMCPPGEYWRTCHQDDHSGYREENDCEAGFGNYHGHGCFEQCVCQHGWWRHPDGHCVPSGHECPIPPPCEEENTAYTDCAGHCEPNCDGWSCYDHWCDQGCACAEGFIRSVLKLSLKNIILDGIGLIALSSTIYNGTVQAQSRK